MAERRRRRALAGLVLWAALLGLPAARAELPDTVERIKPSIAVVGTYMRSRAPAFELKGSGFAVGDGSLVATNFHVARAVKLDEDKLETLAVLVRVDGQLRVREATLIASDPDRDLALLRISGPAVPPMHLADSDRVREGQAVAFTGFPIGSLLGFAPVTHRGIVSSITPIAIPAEHVNQLDVRRLERLKRGSFPVFQLDATAYPGNSGSPLFDPETGQVLGVINMVFVKASKESALTHPSGISYAIPANHLSALIAEHRSRP